MSAVRIIVTILTVSACAGGDAGLASFADTGEPVGSDDNSNSQAMQLRTFAGETQVRAGEQVNVWCLLKSGAEFFRPESAFVTVTPQPAELEPYGHGATFIASAAGTYTASCAAPGTLADREGVRVDVTAGPAASWEVSFDERDCYSATDRLVFDVAVFDAFGNRAYDAPVSAVITPSANVTGNLDHGFRFLADGNYQITLDVDEQAQASTIAPIQTTVRVDATPPVITVETPVRGAMLQSSTSQVTVRGSATDNQSDLVELEIAGQQVPVDDRSAPFEVVASTRVGLTTITGRARDACGNVGYVARSVLRSPAYATATTSPSPADRVDGAFLVQLNQTFADDGDRTDVDDLATLGERVIGSVDFDAMLPAGTLLAHKDPRDCNGCPTGPLFFSGGVDAWRHPNPGRHIHLSPPQIRQVRFVAGGLELAARFENFDFPLRARVVARECDLGCDYDHVFEVDAWVGLDRLDITGTIGANLATGEADASLTGATIDIQGAYLDIECGAFDWACDEVSDLLIDRAAGILEQAAADAIAEMVPPLLEETLESVELSSALALPAPIDVTLGVDAALDSLAFCGPNVGLAVPAACSAANSSPGSVAVGLATQIYPGIRGAGMPATARGPMLLGGTAPGLDSSSSFAVAVRLDAINQLLWSLWYGGALDVPELGDLLETDLDGSLFAGLPPVLMPGENGNLVELGIGNLEVDAVVDVSSLLGEGGEPSFVTVSMTVSAVVGADVALDAAKGSVWLIPDPEPELRFEIHQINDIGYSELLGDALGSLLARELPVLLRDMVAELPLPSFEVGALPGVPEGTVWFLSDADLGIAGNTILFRGTIGSRGAP